MTDTTTQSAPAPFAEPTKAVTGGWIAVFATAWLGVWMAQLTPVQLLLPVQIEAQLNATYWVDNVVAFGIISGIAGLCALVAYPLTGALSDTPQADSAAVGRGSPGERCCSPSPCCCWAFRRPWSVSASSGLSR